MASNQRLPPLEIDSVTSQIPPSTADNLVAKPSEPSPFDGEIESQANSEPPEGRFASDLLGTLLGLLAAIAYTGSNIALKEVARPNDLNWAIWISCTKAMPVTVIAWSIVAYRGWKGLAALPPRRLVLPLFLTGCIVQFGGNVMFQWSLTHVGLALTVPMCFAALLVSGAIMARMFLGEEVTLRSLLAMAVLIVSILLLATGAQAAAQSIIPNVAWSIVAGAVVAATISGLSYSTSGVVIRRIVTGDISLSATLILITTTGVVVLGALSLFLLGPQRMLETTGKEAMWMLVAGLANAVAFFSLSGAYKHATLMRVNFLNATQIAMAAIVGIVWFGEAHTAYIWLGTVLTFAGLLAMGQQRDKLSPKQGD